MKIKSEVTIEITEFVVLSLINRLRVQMYKVNANRSVHLLQLGYLSSET